MAEDHLWQPTASVDVLVQRARIVSSVRRFFDDRHVLEVTVPSLGACTVSDPFIDALQVECPPHAAFRRVSGYLQTSPEYFLKRLLAAGMPDCYYMGVAFRADEPSVKHNPEFTMLEWYRLGWDEQQLCRSVFDLIRYVSEALNERWDSPSLSYALTSYQVLFEQYLGVNPHYASVAELKCLAQSKLDIQFHAETKSLWLDLLFSHFIEPHLKGCVGIFDYPKEQSALANVVKNADGTLVAKRFEIYINGVELANGYQELTCANTFEQRYQKDCTIRKQEGLPPVAYDKKFVDAMKAGLPECAGVALGIDRLIMCLLGEKDISHVMAFSYPST